MKLANPFSTLTEEQIGEVVERLVAAFRPCAIYLFGSHAAGVPTRDSDVDLMIVVDVQPTVEHSKQAYSCLRGLGLPVEPHFCSRERFDRYAGVIGSLQHEIQRKGVLLYAAEA